MGEPKHLRLDLVTVAGVGALAQAAARGSAGAAWLALVGAQKEEMTTEEVEDSQSLEGDCRESCLGALGSLGGDVLAVRVLTLEEVTRETDMDEELVRVKAALETGEWPQGLETYRRMKASLSVLEGAVVFGDRLVIPGGLR